VRRDARRTLYFLARLAEARGNDRDANLIVEALVDDGTKDDVGLVVGLLLDESRSFVDLMDGEVGPPVMLMSTPRAPWIETSSSSGLEIAFCAASTARSSPLAVAAPMSAMPISDMMVRTSLKSRLIKPWTVMRSEMRARPATVRRRPS